MKKLFYLIVVIVAFGLIVAGCIPVVPPTEQGDLSTLTKNTPSTWYVDGGLGTDDVSHGTGTGVSAFKTIQYAINDSRVQDDDTITVAAGTYNERVVINKPLTLQGENRDTTIIDGTGMTAEGIPAYGNNGILIFPGSDYHMQDVGITISGFTVQNFAVIGAGAGAGIYADPTYQYSNIAISDVIAKDNGLSGLYLPNVLNSNFSNIVVDNNDQIGNGQGDGIHCSVFSSSNTFTNIEAKNHDSMGIMVMQAHNNNFTNVNCVGNLVGIYFCFSDSNTVENSSCTGNTAAGIYFYDSDSNTVENSSINNNNKGVRCYIGSNNQIHFSNIEGNEAFGVDSRFALDATCNWWGTHDGPSGVGPGTGDAVSTNVDFDPWISIADLFGPTDPVQIGASVSVGYSYTCDMLPATISWGDGLSDTLVSNIGFATHAYSDAGVYTVTLTIVNSCDICSKKFQYVVVYDPTGGFVTGGGWIYSEAGAYLPDPDAEGKASFGFVSKYKKGQQTPTGNTEFQFKAGDLNFHSNSYDWLVITKHKAMYKGTGTINGNGDYGFMLSAIDEKLTSSTGVDMFRIKIWDSNDNVIYDNQIGDEDDADPTTGIAGGQIVIHKAK